MKFRGAQIIRKGCRSPDPSPPRGRGVSFCCRGALIRKSSITRAPITDSIIIISKRGEISIANGIRDTRRELMRGNGSSAPLMPLPLSAPGLNDVLKVCYYFVLRYLTAVAAPPVNGDNYSRNSSSLSYFPLSTRRDSRFLLARIDSIFLFFLFLSLLRDIYIYI